MGYLAPLAVAVVVMVAGCTGSNSTPDATTINTTDTVPTTSTTAPENAGVAERDVAQAATLTVVGSGVAYGVPDVVLADLVVSVVRDTATDASNVARDVSRNVVNALLEAGVAEEDIRSSDYSLFQEYDYRSEPRELLGFRVRHSYSVKLEVTSAGRVLDAAVAASWDALEVQGTSLMLEDSGPLVDEARAKAWTDCVATAEEMASLAGMTLGEPIRVEEGTSYVQPGPYFGEGANGDGSTAFQPGRVSAIAQVIAEFAISR